MQRLSRTSQIIAMFARYRRAGIMTGFDLGELQEDDPADADADALAERFVSDLEAMGPAFVKLGQALSTRPDLVPASWIAALERIQDDATPAPVVDIQALLEAELGVRASKVFAEIDPQPMAAASLAQVHRAVLHDGRVVALKIQRPDVATTVRSDLDVLARLAGTADALTDAGRRLRLADWIAEFRKAMVNELDYRIEAENLDRFGRHLSGYELLRVPAPLWRPMTREEPGNTTSMFDPSALICLSISLRAPEPTATMMITEPTPMIMPSVVSTDRSRLVRSADRAIEKLSVTVIPPPSG